MRACEQVNRLDVVPPPVVALVAAGRLEQQVKGVRGGALLRGRQGVTDSRLVLENQVQAGAVKELKGGQDLPQLLLGELECFLHDGKDRQTWRGGRRQADAKHTPRESASPWTWSCVWAAVDGRVLPTTTDWVLFTRNEERQTMPLLNCER